MSKNKDTEQKNNNEYNKEGGQLQVEMPSGFTPEFSNSIKMNVSNDMVSLQFAYICPGASKGVVVSEVVLTPQHAIEFHKKLRDTLSQHFTDQVE